MCTILSYIEKEESCDLLSNCQIQSAAATLKDAHEHLTTNLKVKRKIKENLNKIIELWHQNCYTRNKVLIIPRIKLRCLD